MDRRDRSYGGGEKKACSQERGAEGAGEGDDFDDTVGDDNDTVGDDNGDDFDDTVGGDNGDDNC